MNIADIHFDNRARYPVLSEEECHDKEEAHALLMNVLEDMKNSYSKDLEAVLNDLIPTNFRQECIVDGIRDFKLAMAKFVALEERLKSF